MNNNPETIVNANKMKSRFLLLALIWSFVIFFLFFWGPWQELQINSAAAMAVVKLHSWKWAISLGVVWMLVLFILGRGTRSIAGNVQLLRQLDAKLVSSKQESSRQKALFEATVNSMTDTVVFADNQNRIVMINPAFTALTGYTFEEVKGREILFLFTNPETLLNNQGDLNQAVCEIECSLKDESTVPIEALCTQIRNPDGTIIGHLMILRDLSRDKAAEKERAKLETKLRRSSKMETIGTLAGGIAHDFNNILGIILMNTDLALDDIPEGNPVRKNIDRIVEAASRGMNLVKQILTYSRQENQKLIPMMPGSFIKESLKFLNSTTSARVTIVQNINDGFKSIMMDPSLLQELLVDLFSSAMQAINEKGTIEVTGMVVELNENDVASRQNIQPGDYFRLGVNGTGVDIDQTTQERIYDHYSSTRGFSSGPGMALAPVMGIVNSFHGHIALESAAGSGTTVQVFFPVVDEVKEDLVEGDELLQGTERILFVDDEYMLIEMATMFLEEQGFTVIQKSNGREALETFRSKPDEFDIIVTDQTMPEMTGSELAVEVLKIRQDIPIILLSGYSKKISEEKIKELGISEFLDKPFDGKTLARLIRKVLDEKSLPDKKLDFSSSAKEFFS